MDYFISEATPADSVEISALVNSAYRGDSSRQGWTTEADYLDGQRTSPEDLKKQLSHSTILTLRENAAAEILATVSLERINADEFYLGMLTVKPTLQARGVGRVLLESAEDFARARGAKRMILRVVHVREALIAWYLRRGYTKTGETDPFPYGDEKFGLPKVEGLYFERFKKELD